MGEDVDGQDHLLIGLSVGMTTRFAGASRAPFIRTPASTEGPERGSGSVRDPPNHASHSKSSEHETNQAPPKERMHLLASPWGFPQSRETVSRL
jgi:hypothetical protein